MSEDETGPTGTDDLSEWTREWVEARAAEQGVSPGEFLKRLAAAFRAAEEGDVPDLVRRDDLTAIESELDALETELDDLARAVADLEGDVDDKITDVRDRVIQVKREVDAKAPADHDHPDLSRQATEAASRSSSAEERVADLAETLAELDASVDEGFENFREIASHLDDAVADVEEKNTRLAHAIVSMRETVRGVSEREGRRIAADRLREQANRHGIRTADCGDCDATLDVALLTDARCPHCASTFASLEPKRGFFGSATLAVGDRPALEAADVPDATDVDVPDATDVDVPGALADGNGGPVDVTDMLADSRDRGGMGGAGDGGGMGGAGDGMETGGDTPTREGDDPGEEDS